MVGGTVSYHVARSGEGIDLLAGKRVHRGAVPSIDRVVDPTPQRPHCEVETERRNRPDTQRRRWIMRHLPYPEARRGRCDDVGRRDLARRRVFNSR
jgi:hypothetical protein